MDGRGEAEVTVAEEIDLARLYLEIEEIRFGDRLRTQISVDPAVRQARVPSLILQPLVENAIRHGVSQVRGPVRVEIAARASDGRLHLAVRDSGPGLGAPPPTGAYAEDGSPERVRDASAAGCSGAAGGGLGIRNVRERLAALHGSAADLSLRRLPSGGTEALVTLPLDLPARAELTP
jgi:LytS/YehU family sensor histidine kinase